MSGNMIVNLFLVQEVRVGTLTSGEFMFCLQVNGEGQRTHSVSAFSHLPSAQNNSYAKVTCVGEASSGPLQDTAANCIPGF